MKKYFFSVAIILIAVGHKPAQSAPEIETPASLQISMEKMIGLGTKIEQETFLDEHENVLSPKFTQLLLMEARKSLNENNFQKALKVAELAELVAARRSDEWAKARAWSTIGSIHRIQGRESVAFDYLTRSLPLHEKLADHDGVSSALFDIGFIQVLQGGFDLAEGTYERLRQVNERRGNTDWIARALGGLGAVYWSRGEHSRGLQVHKKSLALYSSNGNRFGIAYAMFGIANAYRLLGNDEVALSHFNESLSLSKELKIYELTIRTLGNLATFYHQKPDGSKALEYAEQCLSLSEKTKNGYWVVISLLLLSDLHGQRKDFSKAMAYYERSLAIAETQQYRDLLWKAYLTGGKVQAAQGHVKEAKDLFLKSITAIESVRSGIGRKDMRATYLANGRAPYMWMIQLQMQEQRAAGSTVDPVSLAFQISERGRARSLLEALSEEKPEIDESSPITVAELQAQLLDKDTVLVEYALGDERSYFWAVGPGSLEGHALPRRQEVEAAARHVYELLQNSRRWASDVTTNAEYAEAAQKLSDMILGPVAEQIIGKRLVVVADGALQYIPFSALPQPKGKSGKAGSDISQPLALTNEIVSLPSASVLSVLRREAASRNQKGDGIAVVADPIFSETDERLTKGEIVPKKREKTDLSRMALERAFSFTTEENKPFMIPRLPFTRREAESIFSSAPKGASLKALDFEANREKILKADLSKYRIIHFATHGILHSEHPELSGIVLSLVNEQGGPVNGFLRLNEIYNMNLNADLVVLSACQTALGKEVKGEGMIGLTRGFMYAGSPRVVASLWKVDDVATAELMKIFYQKMLKEKMRPAAALRAAKIAMMKQKRWSAPYYWAAFELQGEWR